MTPLTNDRPLSAAERALVRRTWLMTWDRPLADALRWALRLRGWYVPDHASPGEMAEALERFSRSGGGVNA